mmetsp:Transcript_71971/g.120383  ORF Transcript_71971/g.120383 Transcript_71971/m.120383 type:complete len:94 (-) Transcript_71971:386-667(-)|eukprot:CAMPEP_0174350160 /NCGR_PEP_ID=MMETSP0811_2-20130205/7164_1 /TAXON_ID=73025 ORGANISM="Eutreptiella gymnastica-like, Strain CCMP1594" /NCGR_SAMPLE_ID=MMETSP0811_2 /ASSEMBLY_ACC=CAM_ASM_000667 /LENGTH=93 /DNA_ID=CAMNT_0015478211 /DNA_START=280 /DNA_END=561 /DNA_ORIENTATION=-
MADEKGHEYTACWFCMKPERCQYNVQGTLGTKHFVSYTSKCCKRQGCIPCDPTIIRSIKLLVWMLVYNSINSGMDANHLVFDFLMKIILVVQL